VEITAKEVQFRQSEPPQLYHSIAVPDYVAILARTPENEFPIVQQYRPAIERLTWELPAGLVEPGEAPLATAKRELLEETGLTAGSARHLGSYYSDTGRLENKQHGYFIEASDREPNFMPEENISIRFVSLDEIKSMVKNGEFTHLLHIALVGMYEWFA